MLYYAFLSSKLQYGILFWGVAAMKYLNEIQAMCPLIRIHCGL